jgi:hypothetical protein
MNTKQKLLFYDLGFNNKLGISIHEKNNPTNSILRYNNLFSR